MLYDDFARDVVLTFLFPICVLVYNIVTKVFIVVLSYRQLVR